MKTENRGSKPLLFLFFFHKKKLTVKNNVFSSFLSTVSRRRGEESNLGSRRTPVRSRRLLHDLQIGDTGHVERFEHFLGVGVHLQHVLSVDVRNLRHVVVTSLTLLLLQLDGDASDGSPLDSLHEMGGESGDLVPETLAGDDGDFLGNAFVGVEIRAQLGVIFLDDHPRRLLHRLRTNATHFDYEGLCKKFLKLSYNLNKLKLLNYKLPH